jgi:hypothetical protein
VQARTLDRDRPLTRASAALIKGAHKLHYYFGYKDLGANEKVELYNIQADPEELVDLSGSERALKDEYLTELKGKIQDANQPYV